VRSSREIIFRLRQEAGNLARLARTPRATSAAQPPLAGLPPAAEVARSLAGTPYAAEVERLAERILQHRFPLMGCEIDTGPGIDWRRDYISGKSTPLDYFRRIPYLDFERAGDHKLIWELNRHQHLVLLAQAWRLTGRTEFYIEIEAQLESWWAANPYGRGINWTSALEVAFRAFSWIWVYQIAGDQMSAGMRRRFLESLYAHGRHLAGNLSVYFSPNTHLLGEAVALHAIGTLFPDYPESTRWRRDGGAIVRAQMDAQVHADGSHFEQSTYYHVYALDMLLFSAVMEKMSPDYSARLGRMADYLDALLGPPRRLPFLGDDDGGRLFHPYGPRDCFGRASLAAMARGSAKDYPEIGAWWFGADYNHDRSDQSHDREGVVVPQQKSQLFEDAGIAIMQAGDVHLVADAGPFGGGGAGHSHADTLSFVLRLGDEDLLIDAGTFTYVGDAKWRNWFRGTAAHNTIRINGLDQATPVDPFRWADKPDVVINAWQSNSEEDFLDATCRYRGLEHRRRIRFKKPTTISVLDELTGSGGPHLLEQFWHSDEEVTAESPRSFRLGHGARLLLSHDATLEVGGENGWRSRVFGSKEPAAVICMAWKQALPASFVTIIELSAQ
jgi:Heparinase II/III-like protein/Heparinase II/III N-terminus